MILLKLQSFKVGDSLKSVAPSRLNVINIHAHLSLPQQRDEMYSLKNTLLVLMLVVACDSACPKNCICAKFGSSWVKVKCTNIKQVPRDIPSNTKLL